MRDERQRFVVDTNVVFEGLTQLGGASGLFIDSWLAGVYLACVSRQQEEHRATVLVAEIDSQFAGYLKIAWKSEYVLFEEQSIPEIQDLNVLPDFRRRGVASALMDDVEAMIARTSPEVGIGVGLHPGYNVAQRMYVRRGYIPDGRGVMWRGEFITEGQDVIADDDLVLHLTKKLGVTS